jgi:hypothetical protein
VPVIVTTVPTGPTLGESWLMLATGTTVNVTGLLVPLAVVTLMLYGSQGQPSQADTRGDGRGIDHGY